MLLIIKYRSGTFVIHFRARECERAVSEINGTFCHNNKSYLLIFSYTIIITCPLFFFSFINNNQPDKLQMDFHYLYSGQYSAERPQEMVATEKCTKSIIYYFNIILVQFFLIVVLCIYSFIRCVSVLHKNRNFVRRLSVAMR